MRFVSFSNSIVPEPLAEQNKHLAVPICELDKLYTPPLRAELPYSASLQKQLTGKLLLIEETSFPIDHIHQHYLNGYISYVKGIEKEQGKRSCTRCGNKQQRLFAAFSCYRCKQAACYYCRNCIMMGRISECTPLIKWVGPEWKEAKTVTNLQWDGELSQQQQVASDKMKRIIGTKAELLVWAVCGAGKTEILFESINKAIQQGLKVCLATPRTDVVVELTPRIRAAFPTINVVSLHGESTEKSETGSIVISTTHQLFRYKSAFDVMIIDEVDAFPYSYDTQLQFATKEAAKEKATTIYLSATPSDEMQYKVRTNQLECVKISKRYHGFPLPEPELIWIGNWQKQLKRKHLPQKLKNWVNERIKEKKQAFLFVPTLEVMNQVYEFFAAEGVAIDFVHSEDTNRQDKIKRFRQGDITILITTTILERGVTVPNIDVAVFAAEHQVFTSSALIQIAGRVGRSAEYPSGTISYFHYGKTNAMLTAKREIQAHNRGE